jgi:hypothetical protein
MRRTVYKYGLSLGEQELELPVGAQVLNIGVQKIDGSPQLFLWALVAPETMNKIKHKIFVVGTGHAMPHGEVEHLGTVQHGTYVWHVFKGLLL